jgi:type VI secretion system protein VasD
MIHRRAFLALGAVALARCSSPPPPPVLTLTIIGSPDQNPDPAGHPTSVAVHLYQLTATAKFERADVFALTEHEQQTLGADDLGSEELVLQPGETRTITRDLKPTAQFIGVAVLYRDIDRAQWRAFAPVAASGPSRHALTIKALSATLA